MPKFSFDPSRDRKPPLGARTARSHTKPQVERFFEQMQLPFDAWVPRKAKHVASSVDSTVDLKTFQELLTTFLVSYNSGSPPAQTVVVRGGSRGENRHD